MGQGLLLLAFGRGERNHQLSARGGGEKRDPESKLKRPPRAGSGLRPGTAAQVGISWCLSTVVLSHKGTTALERVGVNAEELF